MLSCLFTYRFSSSTPCDTPASIVRTRKHGDEESLTYQPLWGNSFRCCVSTLSLTGMRVFSLSCLSIQFCCSQLSTSRSMVTKSIKGLKVDKPPENSLTAMDLIDFIQLVLAFSFLTVQPTVTSWIILLAVVSLGSQQDLSFLSS